LGPSSTVAFGDTDAKYVGRNGFTSFYDAKGRGKRPHVTGSFKKESVERKLLYRRTQRRRVGTNKAGRLAVGCCRKQEKTGKRCELKLSAERANHTEMAG